jgi:hypothetical protein
LIDVCLRWRVVPRIDFDGHILTVLGDIGSCSQCLGNLQSDRRVHQYAIVRSIENKPSSTYALNQYVSLKIDEAVALQWSTVRIATRQLLFTDN